MSYKINGDGLVHVITTLTGIKFCTGILKIRSWRTLQWDAVFFFFKIRHESKLCMYQ